MEVAHIDVLPPGPGALLALLRRPLSDARGQGAQRRAPGAGGARARGPGERGDHAEHRSPARQGRQPRSRRGPRLDRALLLPALRRRATRWPRCARARPPTPPGPALRLRPAAEARRGAVRRVPARRRADPGRAAGRGRRPDAVHRLLAGGLPGGPVAADDAGRRRRDRDHHAQVRRPTMARAAARCAGDVVAELEAIAGAGSTSG